MKSFLNTVYQSTGTPRTDLCGTDCVMCMNNNNNNAKANGYKLLTVLLLFHDFPLRMM